MEQTIDFDCSHLKWIMYGNSQNPWFYATNYTTWILENITMSMSAIITQNFSLYLKMRWRTRPAAVPQNQLDIQTNRLIHYLFSIISTPNHNNIFKCQVLVESYSTQLNPTRKNNRQFNKCANEFILSNTFQLFILALSLVSASGFINRNIPTITCATKTNGRIPKSNNSS